MNWLKLKELGNSEYQNGNFIQAIDYYNKAISLDQLQDVLFSNRGLCYLQLNKYEKAENDFKSAIEKNPCNTKAIKRLGSVYIKLGKYQKAKEYIKKAIKQDQDMNVTTNYTFNDNELNRINGLIEKDIQSKTYSKEEKFNLSLSITKELLVESPGNSELKKLHIDNLLNNGLLSEANNYLKTEITEEEKQNEDFIYLSIKYLYYDVKFSKALHAINSILDKKINQNQRQDSKQKFQDLKIKIESIEELKIKAKDFYIKESFIASIDIYLQLVSIDKNNKNFIACMYFNISLCKHKLNEISEALKYSNLSIENNPLYLNAYYRRGIINIELRHYEDAKKDFTKVLEIDPSYREAKIKLSELEMEKEKQKRKDYYKILDIPYNASEYDIRQSYKKLAHKWHPDKNNSNEKNLLFAKSMFEDLTEAYDVLSDKNKRKLYDAGKSFNHYDTDSYYEHEDDNDDYLYKKAEEIYYKSKKKN